MVSLAFFPSLAVVYLLSDLPEGKHYGDEIDVSHPLYHTIQIQAREYRDEQFIDGTLREISLIPIPGH